MALFGDNNQDLTITVKAKDEATAKLNTFSASLGKMTGAVALGTIAASAITKGFSMMRGALSDTIEKWNIQEKAMAQTHAVLASTGHVAGMSADELFKLAASLQATTTYGDEAIIGAQNLLLTFTSLGKDIFPEATAMVLDMSTALGQDLKSSAIQLGKALQDPVLGVTALRRVGVNFNETQLDVIKNLVKTGQSAKAQQLIMAELAREFGGSATAAAKTFAGQMQQVKNKVGDVQETIGRGLTASLSSALVAFNRTTDAMNSNVDVSKRVFEVFSYVTQGAANTAAGIHHLAGAFVIASSYIGQGIAALNGFDQAEKEFWAAFREETSKGVAASWDFALNLKEQNDRTRAGWDEVAEASKRMGIAAPEAYGATGEAAKDAAKKIKDANNAIEDTQKKIEELQASYAEQTASTEQSIGDSIVKQQHKVRDLKKEIRQLERDEETREDAKRLHELEDQYEKEKTALDRMSSVKIALGEQVAEAKRRYALTEFEREMEDYAAKIVREQKQYNAKYAQLQKELADNKMKRDELSAMEVQTTAVVVAESGKRTNAVIKDVNSQISAYQRLAAATRISGGSNSPLPPTMKNLLLPSFDQGGTIPGPINSPQLVIAHGGETVIPNKQSRSGGDTYINVTLQYPSFKSQEDVSTVRSQIDRALRDVIRNHKLQTA